VLKSSLVELCDLVAEQGLQYAKQNQEQFLQIVLDVTERQVSETQSRTVLEVFAFLSWAYANGVWSNLPNTALRRDLMRQSMESLVLRQAQLLADGKSSEGIALVAVDLDRRFRDYALKYNARMKQLCHEGFEPDANAATLCGLEWIQEALELHDQDMELIVPLFNTLTEGPMEIERLAAQVNRAASEKKKGLLSRFFRT